MRWRPRVISPAPGVRSSRACRRGSITILPRAVTNTDRCSWWSGGSTWARSVDSWKESDDMQMTTDARVWLAAAVRRILARSPLGDAERAGITYELMSHLHAAGEAQAA